MLWDSGLEVAVEGGVFEAAVGTGQGGCLVGGVFDGHWAGSADG